jgi:hypothetical protein
MTSTVFDPIAAEPFPTPALDASQDAALDDGRCSSPAILRSAEVP